MTMLFKKVMSSIWVLDIVEKNLKLVFSHTIKIGKKVDVFNMAGEWTIFNRK